MGPLGNLASKLDCYRQCSCEDNKMDPENKCAVCLQNEFQVEDFKDDESFGKAREDFCEKKFLKLADITFRGSVSDGHAVNDNGFPEVEAFHKIQYLLILMQIKGRMEGSSKISIEDIWKQLLACFKSYSI